MTTRDEVEPIDISTAELADALFRLPAPLVITKNKRATSAQNYRINPEGSGQWLDGCWVGTPTRVAAGQAFAAHYVERESLLWLGRYLGTVRDAARSNRNSLVLDLVHCYRITDPVGGSPEHDTVKGILKQQGSVTYSYFRSEVARDEAVSETRFAEVQVRLEQSSFRNAVFSAHGRRCVITGCDVERLLDAAHLPGRDWRAGHNRADDGIPLRADLHRALDAGLIRLGSGHRLIWVDAQLEAQYGQYRAQREGTAR